jgi:hypothetical protein
MGNIKRWFMQVRNLYKPECTIPERARISYGFWSLRFRTDPNQKQIVDLDVVGSSPITRPIFNCPGTTSARKADLIGSAGNGLDNISRMAGLRGSRARVTRSSGATVSNETSAALPDFGDPAAGQVFGCLADSRQDRAAETGSLAGRGSR